MARRRHPCDACGAERKSWQRLCSSCWARLPGDIRTGVVEAWKSGHKAVWRGWRTKARAAIAGAAPPARSAPADAYHMIAARLGERD